MSPASDDAAPGLAARRVAWRVLVRVVCEGALLEEAQQAQDRALARLSAQDRALAGQLVRTALRRRGQIEALIGQYLNKPLPQRACGVRALLLLAAAQVLFLRVPAHAAIDTAVRLVKGARGLGRFAGLVNAVLRRVAREGEARLARCPETLNIPAWLRQNWRRAQGMAALRQMAEEMLREPPLDISVKRADEIQRWAEALDALVLPTGSLRLMQARGDVASLPGFAEGAWWVQDVAASLPVKLAASARGGLEGARVADLCAAPGGKTAQLAALGADVVAVDVSARRLERLRRNLERLQLAAEVVQADVLRWQPQQTFDLVVLDAPCTATGTLRRHPDVLWHKTPRQMAELVQLQRRMLARAAALVKPGGMLVYCVCSLQPQEGEEQAQWFLQEQAGRFARLEVAAEELEGMARLITPKGDVRTLPHLAIGAARGMDGFFIARLVKAA